MRRLFPQAHADLSPPAARKVSCASRLISQRLRSQGAGFGDLAPQLLALAVFGTVILAVSALRFRKQIG